MAVKVSEIQKNATNWSKALDKLNEAKNGYIPITYKDDIGNKKTGYISLLDIELEVNGKTVTFGSLLTEMANNHLEVLKQVTNIANGVESVGKDLLVVRTDELGFIQAVYDYNAKIDLVIANQSIPSDYAKGYYYVKDGKIVESEERKLELFPDFV